MNQITGGHVSAAATVKRLAHESGFDLARIAPASVMHDERVRYLEWLAAGRQGSMRWMNNEHAIRASDPRTVLAHAASVVSVGMAYWTGHRAGSRPDSGDIARYAWGRDYHAVLGERLQQLSVRLAEEYGGDHRWYVDTGPTMDKALAARSGIGFYGKNTNILTESFGSWVLLGEIITSLLLPPDPPLRRDCGGCRVCQIACPTGALRTDYSIDSNRCISYLTIEHRDAIPHELRPLMGSWVFGCDICQDVCPPTMRPYLPYPREREGWAHFVKHHVRHLAGPAPAISSTVETTTEDHPFVSKGSRQQVDLIWLLGLSHDEYVEAFRGSSIRRAKVWMLRRNAAVALGNVGTVEAIEPLGLALTDDHPLVRGHSAWALGCLHTRLGSTQARNHLIGALGREQDATVRNEIEMALARESEKPDRVAG